MTAKIHNIYKIKQISTGLFLKELSWKSPRGGDYYITRKRVAVFAEESKCRHIDIDRLNDYIRQAVEYKIIEILEDSEIVPYKVIPEVILPGKTTLRMKTVRKRYEANIIMAKLRGGR